MTGATPEHTLTLRGLTPFYGRRQALLPVSMEIPGRQITAVIGPSGCGKSTLLRCLNCLHETVPGARAGGAVLLDGEDLYAPGVDARLVRRKIGMVFQQPVALRTRSVFDNVAVGLQLAGLTNRAILAERVERSLRAAALWDEIKDKLGQPGPALSGGQQQRLSIARALVVEPEVLLLDEPCAALDPLATFKIEELLLGLRQHYTLVIVTHNLQQAGRLADQTAFFDVDSGAGQLVGRLVEYAGTAALFAQPADPRTADYLAGRFG